MRRIGHKPGRHSDHKPEPEVRDVLKRNGFKWAPSQGAWQRQLTDNAIRAAKAVTAELSAR